MLLIGKLVYLFDGPPLGRYDPPPLPDHVQGNSHAGYGVDPWAISLSSRCFSFKTHSRKK